MKLIIVLAAVALAQADKLDRQYLPPSGHSHTHSSSSGAYSGFGARSERPNSGRERNAAIIRQDYTNNIDSYSYSYETDNGISAEEKGVATNGNHAQGGFSYTGDDGKVYSVWYTADENGFRPQGDHLPTPPPIPKEILKALELNARDEAAGIFDDGSYKDTTSTRHSGHSQQHSYNRNAQSNGYSKHTPKVDNMYLPPLIVV